jgi:hypothetical protein
MAATVGNDGIGQGNPGSTAQDAREWIGRWVPWIAPKT